MRVLVSGGTGFVGASLCRVLQGEGHAVTIVTRDPEHASGEAVGWDAVVARSAKHARMWRKRRAIAQ